MNSDVLMQLRDFLAQAEKDVERYAPSGQHMYSAAVGRVQAFTAAIKIVEEFG